MRHIPRATGLVLATAVIGLAGCASNGHRDVLLFGTQTKFGIDIARQPNEPTPEFTVGYKRQEFVYMPLLVNGNDSCYLCNDAGQCNPIQGPMYQGTRTADRITSTDAYSVFASFGADFGGGGGTEGGLAQFFATGVAAQELGKNTSIGRALAVQPASTVAVDVLEEANERAFEALSEAQRVVIADEVGSRPPMIDAIVALSRQGGKFDVATWKANVAKLADAEWKAEKALLETLAS